MEIKAKILVVDDNLNLCKTMAFVLRRKGYEVITVNDGFQAIEVIKKRSFDIIFMDIKMPFLNGVESYKKIKVIDPNAVVIMMTAYSVEELVQIALEEGAYGIIYKPIDFDKIITIIEKTQEENQGGFILVIDDDVGITTTINKILSNHGYNVAVAESGDKAISMMKETTYDIVLIDMKLPTINGLETYHALKEIHPKVIAVMMTGYPQEMEELIQEALNESAYSCLYKPFDMADIIKLTEEVYEKRIS